MGSRNGFALLIAFHVALLAGFLWWALFGTIYSVPSAFGAGRSGFGWALLFVAGFPFVTLPALLVRWFGLEGSLLRPNGEYLLLANALFWVLTAGLVTFLLVRRRTRAATATGSAPPRTPAP